MLQLELVGKRPDAVVVEGQFAIAQDVVCAAAGGNQAGAGSCLLLQVSLAGPSVRGGTYKCV